MRSSKSWSGPLRGEGWFWFWFWFWFVCLGFRWRPLCVSGLPLLPLCGAALTFFAAAKKVSKESGLTPPVLISTHGLSTSPQFLRQPASQRPLPTSYPSPHPAKRFYIRLP